MRVEKKDKTVFQIKVINCKPFKVLNNKDLFVIPRFKYWYLRSMKRLLIFVNKT